MRSNPRLGPANLALVSLYFAPVWGADAIRALMSPFAGFEDPAHAAATVYFRQLFDLGLDGLLRTSSLLAGLKLVIAVGFVAYLIEFARAVAMDREPDRETTDVVLMLSLGAMLIWALPALALGDAAVTRLHATQFLLLVGAAIIITVERLMERPAETISSRTTMLARAQEAERRAVASEGIAPLGNDHRPWLQGWVGTRKSAT